MAQTTDRDYGIHAVLTPGNYDRYKVKKKNNNKNKNIWQSFQYHIIGVLHDITEILLKVVLNTITPTLISLEMGEQKSYFHPYIIYFLPFQANHAFFQTTGRCVIALIIWYLYLHQSMKSVLITATICELDSRRNEIYLIKLPVVKNVNNFCHVGSILLVLHSISHQWKVTNRILLNHKPHLYANEKM